MKNLLWIVGQESYGCKVNIERYYIERMIVTVNK